MATVGRPSPNRSTARRCACAMWRCSSHRGVGHDPTSPSNDRGHADSQPRPRTQTSYVEQVDRFARHFRKSPERLGTAEIRAWQLYLAQDKRLAASSISLAVAALRFLYTVTLRREWTIKDDIPTCRQPHQLPEVLSPAEVSAFLDAVEIPKQQVILTVCYAAGLRVSEFPARPSWDRVRKRKI